MEQETVTLIRDLREHRPAACQRLFTEYGPMVFRMVQRIVTRREDAEEVYQDVFFKALRGIDGYDSRQATLATWLGRIAYHESLNFVRGKKPTLLYIEDSDQGSDILEAPDDAPQDDETIRQLERALAMLPPHEQVVVSMFYYDNMSLADIAFVTGSIPSTVGSQLSRIRKKLYRIIKTLCIMNELKNDNNLRQAVSRREQQLPPMPANLNKRLMQRIAESEPARSETKPRRWWLYAAVAVAASIALLIIFNFGQEQTPQEPLVAQTVEQPTAPVPEPIEGESVIEEPSNTVSEPVEAPAPQPTHKPAKKHQETVMQLVELIPTSETASANVKTLPASLIEKVKAYDKQSDLSRTTGIDEIDPLVARTTGIDEIDPLVAMATQVENIRQRGQRLQQEIDNRIDN